MFGLFGKKGPSKVIINSGEYEITVQPDENLLAAALKAGVSFPHDCRVGSCGSCRATIVEGEGKYPSSPCDPTTLLHKEEMDNGMVIACQWVPTTDVTVDVELGKEGDKRGMV